jgi:hypothetical protein
VLLIRIIKSSQIFLILYLAYFRQHLSLLLEELRQIQTTPSAFAPLETDGFDGDVQMHNQSEDRLRGFHHWISTQNQASLFGCYK